MTAYELADIIEDDMEDGFGMGFLKDAVSMIRQQADRIAELEKEVLMWENAEVPTEVMADLIQELERRGFITTPQIKELSDAIKIIEELRVDADMNYKDYENTYADGWDDAFNEILSALYERHGVK